MIDHVYILIPLIALFAFFLKGITGTGTSTVIIALSSFLIPAKTTVVLASFINIFGGLAMIKVDPVPLSFRYWGPVAFMMIVGSVIGAWTLAVIPNESFYIVLGSAFFLASLWFLFRNHKNNENEMSSPSQSSASDLSVGAFAGFCGGFIGINAPPLILHFGRVLNKGSLRRLLVLIFIPAAIAQTLTFAHAGLLNKQIVFMGLSMLPSLAIGIYLGNKAHFKISETMFKKILGILLLVVSARLLLKGIV